MSSGETSRASDLGETCSAKSSRTYSYFWWVEGFAERLDVFEERFDGFLERQRLFVFSARAGEFKAALFRAQFKALSFLRL